MSPPVSAQPLKGLETKVSHRGKSTLCMRWSQNKVFGHRGSGELLWLAALHAYHHSALLGETSATHRTNSPGRGQSEALHLESSWPHVPLLSADFNLHLFAVINYNREYTGYSEFCEPL